jgi:hypothetical protein
MLQDSRLLGTFFSLRIFEMVKIVNFDRIDVAQMAIL